MAAAAENNNPPIPMLADNQQWRIVWYAPNEEDEEDIVTRFHQAWAIAVAPARIENEPGWVLPEREFIWNSFANVPAVQSLTVANHADGRSITLSRV
jgi:hypothetical protein